MPPKGVKRFHEEGNTNASASKSKKTARTQTAGKESDNNANKNKEKESSTDPTANLDPYEYVTICRPRADLEAENDAKPAKQRLKESELFEQDKCDGGTECMCNKDPKDHPEWRWVVMREGKKRKLYMTVYSNYSNPGLFHMHVYSDHHGYGIGELIENLLIEFKKAKNPQEEWVVVETIAHWLFTFEELQPFLGVDDGQKVHDYAGIVGTTLLAALNTLDRNDLLKPDSEFKDIALVIGLYLEVAANFGDALDWPRGDESLWPNQIVTFAKEKGIEIDMPFGVEKRIQRFDTGEKLPRKAVDRFKFKPLFKWIEQQYGTKPGPSASKPTIGGHKFDITKWSREDRAEYAFDDKDPLPDKIVQDLKEGKWIMFR